MKFGNENENENDVKPGVMPHLNICEHKWKLN